LDRKTKNIEILDLEMHLIPARRFEQSTEPRCLGFTVAMTILHAMSAFVAATLERSGAWLPAAIERHTGSPPKQLLRDGGPNTFSW